MRYPQQFLYKQTSYTFDFTSPEVCQSFLFLWYFMIHLHTYARVAASVWPLCMTNWRARAREHENMCTIMDINKYHFIKKDCPGNEPSTMNYLRTTATYFWGYVIIHVVALKADGSFVSSKCSQIDPLINLLGCCFIYRSSLGVFLFFYNKSSDSFPELYKHKTFI